MRAVRPWRRALRQDLFFPASVRGPVESWALRRLDSIWTTFSDVDIGSLPFTAKSRAETPTLQPNPTGRFPEFGGLDGYVVENGV